jgi:hypothetical protein
MADRFPPGDSMQGQSPELVSMSSEPSPTSPPSQLVTVADLAQVLAQLTSAMKPGTESGPKAQEHEKYDGDPDKLEAYLTSLHLRVAEVRFSPVQQGFFRT